MTTRESTEERLSTADFAAAPERGATAEENASERQAGSEDASADARVTRQVADRADSERQAPLFAGNQADDFRGRWSDIQAGFVDEPRRAVEQADTLVAEVMQRLAQVFADERAGLEQAWDSGQNTDTEALRQALRRYRSFFDRLLSM